MSYKNDTTGIEPMTKKRDKPTAKRGRPVKNEIKLLNASARDMAKAILKVKMRELKFQNETKLLVMYTNPFIRVKSIRA